MMMMMMMMMMMNTMDMMYVVGSSDPEAMNLYCHTYKTNIYIPEKNVAVENPPFW